jgi:hypothetical protein
MSVEQVKSMVEARVQAAIDEGSKRPGLQIAEPEGAWNLWALGPIQVIGVNAPPLLPHKVIRIGEDFFVAVVIWLSPTFPVFGTNACDFLSGLLCEFRLNFCTVDMCAVKPLTQLSPTNIKVATVKGQCFYVHVEKFTAPDLASCMIEMNICCTMVGCTGLPTALAGFVTEVFDFDADTFYPPVGPAAPAGPPTLPSPLPTPFPGVGPGFRFNQPIRFMIA